MDNTCGCGDTLQFMGYILRKGYDPLLVEVGCSACNIWFYLRADSSEEIKELPRMNQIDYLRVWKHGSKRI